MLHRSFSRIDSDGGEFASVAHFSGDSIGIALFRKKDKDLALVSTLSTVTNTCAATKRAATSATVDAYLPIPSSSQRLCVV